MKQIDEQGYKDGGAAFNKGKSLRSVIEAKIAAHNATHDKQEDYAKAEDYQMSYEIGFADALLSVLRRR